MRQTTFVVSTTNNSTNHHHSHHQSSSISNGNGNSISDELHHDMCSTNPTSRFSETMLAASLGVGVLGGGSSIGRTLISAMDLKLRCSANGCECANFIAAKDRLRSCDGCTHSWITHLFEKLLRDETLSIFDVCSLALYGTHALPIRLKIVIERLLGTLQPEEIDKILRSFGWTSPDLARGYMLQEPRGGLLTRWSMLPREEEILILQQFLRFAPTRSLSFSLLKDDFQFTISAQQQLQLQQQQQHSGQVQQQLQLPAPPMIPTANMIEATTKIKTENSALNLSAVHSRSRSIPAPPAISPPTTPSSAYSQHLSHQHHHRRRRHSQNHNSHHHNFHHQIRSHGSHGHGRGDRPERRSSTGGAESSTDEEPSQRPRTDDGPRRRDSEPDGNGSQPPVDLSFNSNSNTKSNTNSGSPINHTSVGGMTQLMGHGNHNSHSYKNNSTGTNSMNSNSNHHNNTSINNNNNNIGKLVEEHHHQMQMQHRLRERHSREREPRMPKEEKSSHDSMKASPDTHTQIINHRQHHQHWSPLTANPSQLVNPATGKRRVQCSVCLKTFCDKGALKIHFSAVHLREMHKCTVSGCNMMFSSRRSRNRHSANPNPKLHSPHLRRRISPHDGRSSNPLIPTPMLCGPGGMIPGVPFGNGLKLDDDIGHHMEEMGYLSPSSSSSSLTSEKSPLLEESASRRDGARKRKLSNPVRLPSVPDDSNDDFCCYDDGTEVVPDNEEAPEDGEHSNDEDMDEDDGDKNHLERLESLPIFSNHDDERDSHGDGVDRDDDLASTGSPDSTGSDSIPIDKENPRRCIACGKEFQNHFGVKTHYQNVHLKVIDPLMHKCTVDGCNAAFPSKRSRDRHASNLNLHRKLLSTSDGSNGSDGGEDHPNSGIQSMVSVATTLSQQIQQQQQLFAAGISSRHPFNPFLLNGAGPGSALNQVTPGWNPFLPFPVFPGVFNTGAPPPPGSIMSPTRIPPMTHATSPSSSVSPPQNIAPATALSLPPTSPSSSSSSKNGSNSGTECRLCGKIFEQSSAFLHHMETVHSNEEQAEQFHCRKCSASFSSRRKLDSHDCCH